MEVEQVDLLLDREPMPLEMGIERLPSAALHVASRTDMHGCKGRMIDWWFGWLETNQHYLWWHPTDHVSSAWRDWAPGRYVGATHVVEESLGGGPVLGLNVQFRDPTEFFSADALERAFKSGDVSAVVSGRIGTELDSPRDEQGRVLGGRLFHVAGDTDFGCVLRSHFYLGVDLPPTREEREKLIPDEVGLGLLKHSYNEFSMLSRFLPSLYHAESRERERVPVPW